MFLSLLLLLQKGDDVATKKNEPMNLTKTNLADLYSRKKNVEICKELGITMPTLISYLNYYDIELKGKGNRFSKKKIELI